MIEYEVRKHGNLSVPCAEKGKHSRPEAAILRKACLKDWPPPGDWKPGSRQLPPSPN